MNPANKGGTNNKEHKLAANPELLNIGGLDLPIESGSNVLKKKGILADDSIGEEDLA